MKQIIFASFILCYSVGYAQKIISVSSPGKKISFSFSITKETPQYSVLFKGKPVITDAGIGLSFLGTGEFKSNLKAGKPVFRSGEENYELIVGKIRFVRDRFNELVIPLQENGAPHRKINFVVRAFDDGLAFRYEFPGHENQDSVFITEESTHFKFIANPKVLALFLPNYTTSHEGEYSSLYFNEIKEDTLIAVPALFELPGKIYAAITEAALVNHAGMYLSKQSGVLTSKLSPLPNQRDIKVKAKLPHVSPWRVILLNDRLGGLIETNMLTSLNEPCKIKDLSWIKPGKTTFPGGTEMWYRIH